MTTELWRVVNTDNFGGDYPDEHFVGSEFSDIAEAECLREQLDKNCGDYSSRYHIVVKLPYTLQPGFEP
jgi:hypothetical protein